MLRTPTLRLRTTATRSIPESLSRTVPTRLKHGLSPGKTDITSQFHSLGAKRPQVVVSRFQPLTAPLLRYATSPEIPQHDKINRRQEKELAKQKLEVDKEAVTADSSVRKVFETSQARAEEGEVLGGVKRDINTIKDTLALEEVPMESYLLGAAGTLPYLAMSISTVYLSYCINHATVFGSTFLFTPKTAHELLAMIEPVEIGFGASILSFLGAIHWGLEYAGYGGHHGYRRYAIGVIPPAVAWPTMLMPFEYALITQFVAFSALYFADARATVKGWVPPWYATYRFVLTLVAGGSIVLTLIGRGQIAVTGPGAADRLKEIREAQRANQPGEEEAKRLL